jgi:hypothetical protein
MVEVTLLADVILECIRKPMRLLVLVMKGVKNGETRASVVVVVVGIGVVVVVVVVNRM